MLFKTKPLPTLTKVGDFFSVGQPTPSLISIVQTSGWACVEERGGGLEGLQCTQGVGGTGWAKSEGESGRRGGPPGVSGLQVAAAASP